MERLPLSSSILPAAKPSESEAAHVTRTSPSLRRFRFAVWLAFALLASLIVGVALSLIRFDREQALKRAESELLSLTRVLEEHVARSFGETESVISEIAGHVVRRGGLEAFGEQELQALLRQTVKAGGEGLMLHRGTSLYRSGRTDDLMKLKPWEDAEAKVIAHLPGQGKHAGRLGALLVETPQGLRLKLGTGFTDTEREHPPQVGAWITYRFRGTTDRGIPRFASYLRVREDWVEKVPTSG